MKQWGSFVANSSKSGLTKEERQDYLRAHGFDFARHGKGDHHIWINTELRELGRRNTVEAPANLLSNPGQQPWEIVLPDDPAKGTWHRISKLAEWADEKVAEINGREAGREAHRKIVEEFREAREEITQWKRETRHRLTAGLDPNPAPDSYHNMKEITARYRQAKGPGPS